MPKFAANLSLMSNEHDFLDRFAAAASDGFSAVEFLFPYAFEAVELGRRLRDNGLRQVLFNAPPGDWAAGERGIASLPGRQDEFRRGIAQALEYAAILGNTRLHVMAGLRKENLEREHQRAVYLENLAYAAREAQDAGVTLLIEPINQRDMPGYFLTHQSEAQAICRELGVPNLAVQFDIYHCQVTEGDIAMTLRRDIGNIGHMQIAGVPDRHEPDLGELNYPYLFELVDDLGYDGWIGCEYRPQAGTSEGLGWLKNWQRTCCVDTSGNEKVPL